MYHYGMILLILPNILSAFMPVGLFSMSVTIKANTQNLASLNVCRALPGLGSSVAMPAAAGMIGTVFPPGKKKTYAFVAVSCGKVWIVYSSERAHREGGASGASYGKLVAGAFVDYTR